MGGYLVYRWEGGLECVKEEERWVVACLKIRQASSMSPCFAEASRRAPYISRVGGRPSERAWLNRAWACGEVGGWLDGGERGGWNEVLWIVWVGGWEGGRVDVRGEDSL